MSMRIRLARAAALVALLATAAGCDDLIFHPREDDPVRFAVTVAPAALGPQAAPELDEAFQATDSARVVLILAPYFSGLNAFLSSGGRLADTTFAFVPGDTVRLSLELEDSVLVDTEVRRPTRLRLT